MAGETLNISYDEVKVLATNIVRKNDELKDKLNSIQKQMQTLNECWESKAATTIKSKFESQKSKIDKYYEVIKSYSDFLNEVVTRYTNLDQELDNYANQFDK